MIKVLHLLEATEGGTRRHVVDLLTGLSQKYHNELELHFGYSLIRADSGFRSYLDSNPEGICFFEIPMTRAVKPLNDLKCLVRIINYARDNNIDIIHAHSAKAGFLGRLAAKIIPGVRSIYTPNASPFRISKIYHYLEKVAGWLFTDAIIAVSESEKREIVENKIVRASKVHVVNSGISRFYTYENRGNRNNGDCVVGTIGRLTAQKAPFRFMEIAKKVKQTADSSIKFKWVGDGELRGDVEKYINDNDLSQTVELTGWKQDIEDELRAMDIFVLASDYESFGYVTLEAMQSSLPCIASRVPGSVDLIVPEITGYLADRENIEEYVGHILVLARDWQKRQAMGEAGKQRWEKVFNLDQMVEGTYLLYRNIL